MLLEFGGKNYYSFKEGFEISLRLGATCPSEISQNKEFTNILCVKGANASGKTNALKSLSFLKEFCSNSFNYKPEDEIECEPFFQSKEPIELFLVFSIDGIEYRYELELTKGNVVSERLFKKEKRQTKLILRENDSFSYIHPSFKDFKQIKLRKNASFISTGNQYELKSIVPIYNFFQAIIRNVYSIGLGKWTSGVNITSKYYNINSRAFSFVKSIIKKCDFGIHDIHIEEKINEKGEKIFLPIFHHKIGGKTHFLGYANQSSGTQSLYLQLGGYELVLNRGGILVLDEFDINLHPDILPVLLELFEDQKINQKDAQLIFSTHNVDIMDKLGKYRIILTTKDNNESFLYRLDEIGGDLIRNDRTITPIYKAGKIGGVPKIWPPSKIPKRKIF